MRFGFTLDLGLVVTQSKMITTAPDETRFSTNDLRGYLLEVFWGGSSLDGGVDVRFQRTIFEAAMYLRFNTCSNWNSTQ